MDNFGEVGDRIRAVVKDVFHIMYYTSDVWNGDRTTWMGVPVYQTPLDLWVLQEILWETMPDYLIETGSGKGGSALYDVSVWPGKVISIDNREQFDPQVTHERIEYLAGSSIDPDLVASVKERIRGKKVMVYLDSDHRPEHVRAELETWGPIVTEECYMIVHDTNLNGRPVSNGFHQGLTGLDPGLAVEEFLKLHPEFVADKSREKFMLTFSPNGFLKKVPR